MAFTVRDYQDLLRLLRERPEWREELRSLLLTEELLSLPQEFKRLTEQVRMLVEAQRRTEERVERLEGRVGRLEEEMAKLTEQVRMLVERHRKLEDVVGSLKGRVLEMTYAERAGAYFGMILRRVRLVEPGELEELESILSPEEYREILLLDLVVKGRLKGVPGEPEVVLAVEVSSVVDEGDIERAARRARILKRAGYKAIPIAAGEELTREGEDLAKVERVALMMNGRVSLWEEATASWLGESG